MIEGLEFLEESFTTDLRSVINVIEANSPSLREQTAVIVDGAGRTKPVKL